MYPLIFPRGKSGALGVPAGSGVIGGGGGVCPELAEADVSCGTACVTAGVCAAAGAAIASVANINQARRAISLLSRRARGPEVGMTIATRLGGGDYNHPAVRLRRC